MKLKEIAEKLSCTLAGDGDVLITRVSPIKEAREGELTFIANPKYMRELKHTKASAVILSHKAPHTNIPSLRCDNPYYIFARALELFYTGPVISEGIHRTAIIHESSKIGFSPSIHPYVVIGNNVVIGDNPVIYPGVTIYDNVSIGQNVILHSNVVIRENSELGNNVIIQNGSIIGSDGFSFARLDDGSQYKIVNPGKVIIEDNVEIQANSVVDRATIGTTVIGKGTKVDNLVQIAHGCRIGENCIICGQVGLSGSTDIGNNVILAGQVGTAGHMKIGDNVQITGQSGVTSSVQRNRVLSGTPAISNSLWRRAAVSFSKIPEFFKRLKKLEKKVAKFEKTSDHT